MCSTNKSIKLPVKSQHLRDVWHWCVHICSLLRYNENIATETYNKAHKMDRWPYTDSAQMVQWDSRCDSGVAKRPPPSNQFYRSQPAAGPSASLCFKYGRSVWYLLFIESSLHYVSKVGINTELVDVMWSFSHLLKCLQMLLNGGVWVKDWIFTHLLKFASSRNNFQTCFALNF